MISRCGPHRAPTDEDGGDGAYACVFTSIMIRVTRCKRHLQCLTYGRRHVIRIEILQSAGHSGLNHLGRHCGRCVCRRRVHRHRQRPAPPGGSPNELRCSANTTLSNPTCPQNDVDESQQSELRS